MNELAKVVAVARVKAQVPMMKALGVYLELREDGTTTWRPEDAREFSQFSEWDGSKMLSKREGGAA